MADITAELHLLARKQMAAQAQEDEAIIRQLLYRWVSGLEPAVVRDKNHQILGLCDAAAPLGSYPFILRPTAK